MQPIIGWIMTSAYPAPVPFFGLFELPAIWPEDRALSEQLSVVHLYVGLAIAVVAAMHIGAALLPPFHAQGWRPDAHDLRLSCRQR